MDLQALSDFNLVAAHGGFGRASRASGLPKATLSRRISKLEQSLGVRLIERGSRSLRLTDEGRALREPTDGLLSEIAEAGEAVALGASTLRGRLRRQCGYRARECRARPDRRASCSHLPRVLHFPARATESSDVGSAGG